MVQFFLVAFDHRGHILSFMHIDSFIWYKYLDLRDFKGTKTKYRPIGGIYHVLSIFVFNFLVQFFFLFFFGGGGISQFYFGNLFGNSFVNPFVNIFRNPFRNLLSVGKFIHINPFINSFTQIQIGKTNTNCHHKKMATQIQHGNTNTTWQHENHT